MSRGGATGVGDAARPRALARRAGIQGHGRGSASPPRPHPGAITLRSATAGAEVESLAIPMPSAPQRFSVVLAVPERPVGGASPRFELGGPGWTAEIELPQAGLPASQRPVASGGDRLHRARFRRAADDVASRSSTSGPARASRTTPCRRRPRSSRSSRTSVTLSATARTASPPRLTSPAPAAGSRSPGTRSCSTTRSLPVRAQGFGCASR